MKFYQNIKFIIVLVFFFFGCTKEDDSTPEEKVVPYPVQYETDIKNIETFLKEHTMTVDSDFNVTYKKIENPNVNNDISIMNQTNYPIQFITVNDHGVNYKIYYISFREGVGTNPTLQDDSLVVYTGSYLSQKTDYHNESYISNTTFDTITEANWITLSYTMLGWKSIIPLFKSGNVTVTSGNTSYTDFGSGVMFLPSGMAYYNKEIRYVPKYSPLIWSFKLMDNRKTP